MSLCTNKSIWQLFWMGWKNSYWMNYFSYYGIVLAIIRIFSLQLLWKYYCIIPHSCWPCHKSRNKSLGWTKEHSCKSNKSLVVHVQPLNVLNNCIKQKINDKRIVANTKIISSLRKERNHPWEKDNHKKSVHEYKLA